MRWWAAVLVAFALVAASCDTPHTGVPGTAPARYRDELFASTSITRDLSYGTAVTQGGQTSTLLLDLFAPVGDTVTSRPAIVWVHGGAFRTGDKTSSVTVTEAQLFARLGYVTTSINYRLVSGGCGGNYDTPTCVQAMTDAYHDAQAAVRFLRAHASEYGIDPTRIAIAGTSAGAITALHVAFDSDDPGTSGPPDQPSDVQAAVAISGAKRIGSASTGDAPTLLFHGTADPLIPYQWAVDTYNEAKAAGLTSYLTTFVGAGHVPIATYRDAINTQTANFLFWEMHLADAAH